MVSKKRNKRRRQGAARPVGMSAPHQSQDETRLIRASQDVGPGGGQPDNGGGQVQVLVGLIATGALDDHLGTIQAAISQRHHDHQRAASNQAAARLQIGDRVMLNHEIRPLYLHGATGTVTGWASQNTVVQLDNPTGRFTTGEVRCPPLGLQRLSE